MTHKTLNLIQAIAFIITYMRSEFMFEFDSCACILFKYEDILYILYIYI